MIGRIIKARLVLTKYVIQTITSEVIVLITVGDDNFAIVSMTGNE